MKYLFLLICIALNSSIAFAHKASDSYLTLKYEDQKLLGRWDIALRDLDFGIGLDGNNDGLLTWGEIKNRQEMIEAYALNRFQITSEQEQCPLKSRTLKIDEHSDGHYAVLEFEAVCTKVSGNLVFTYLLFFDLDAQHRGLFNYQNGQTNKTFIFSPANAQFAINDVTNESTWNDFADFCREGIWHIWIGYDHILFLISLLLPAALIWEGKVWREKQSIISAFWDVLAVVTAFTLAHSITLSLAALGYIALPSQWIESAIAASVALAAFNNILPFFVRRRTWVAFGFGLIHGLGIASVLLDLGLPETKQLLALASFNIGVEVGQLAIVGAVFPIILLLSRYRFYPAVVMKAGSCAIVFLALVWLAERSLNFEMNIF